MHFIDAFIITYIFSVFLVINNIPVSLSYAHRKRELNFINYPANILIANTRDYNNYYQKNPINDPGYTTQNEINNDDKPLLDERTENITNSQNLGEPINPSEQMFHLLHMPIHPNKRQQTPTNENVNIAYHAQLQHHPHQFNGNNQNLAYVGPHLFPTQLPHNYENTQLSNVPTKNFNIAPHNIYPAQFLLTPYQQNFVKDSKFPSKMEAPFIPSQFLGYDQQQRQQLPQQPQLPQQNQQSIRPLLKIPLKSTFKPVHEQHHVSSYQPPNLMYMAPNNVYDLYRKSN